MTTVILLGPQGCGKTVHAATIAAALGCAGVVDDWRPGRPIQPGRLHLTNLPVTSIDPLVEVVLFSDVRVHAAILAARQ